MTTRKRKTGTAASSGPKINLDQKAKVIRRKLKALDGLSRRTLDAALDVGRDLAECEDAIPHGELMAWLDQQGIEYRTARRLIDLYRWPQEDPANFDKLSTLPISTLYTFARKSIHDIEEIVRRLEDGETISPTKPKAAKTKSKPSPPVITSEYTDETPRPTDEQVPSDEAQAEPQMQSEPLQLVAPAEANGHAVEPQAAPPPVSDEAAAAAFLAALADHPPPDDIDALVDAFHAQTSLSFAAIDRIRHILVSLWWHLRDEATPHSGGWQH